MIEAESKTSVLINTDKFDIYTSSGKLMCLYNSEFRPVTLENGKEVELLFHIKLMTYQQATTHCLRNDAVLVVVYTQSSNVLL